MELENIGSMITIKGTNNCLGYLMHVCVRRSSSARLTSPWQAAEPRLTKGS